MDGSLLFDFTSSNVTAPQEWRSLDDDVMGGVSNSRFVDTAEGAAFTGTVSLEHGGGFASIRAPEGSLDLSDKEGVRLRLRGDGNRYQFTMYTTSGGPISYRAPLSPPSQWTSQTVPFKALTPYQRGDRVSEAPPFDASQVRTLGFLIADEQAGPFRLEIAWIKTIPCGSAA